MSFSPPPDLKGQVLHIWKILDRPQVLKDKLYIFIAFELYMKPLDEAMTLVKEAIDQEFLLEDESLEYVQLSPDLKREFEEWQTNGKEKAKKMKKILNQPWRPPKEISQKQKYNAFLTDLIDPVVYENAGKLRSSSIKLETTEFNNKISGKARDLDNNGELVYYPFIIDIDNNIIAHNCPNFINLRINHKKFCSHLGRLLMKLFTKDPEHTIDLLRNLVINKEKWTFQSLKK